MGLLKDLFGYEDPNPFEDENAAQRERVGEFVLLSYLGLVITCGLLFLLVMSILSLTGNIDPVAPWEAYR